MGRLGPLTSQALGRSPYDDVVGGTGEADPHEPERQYDEKGRVVNPETKKIIKNVIRAHNEVMQVIGVAELENGSVEADIALAREHQQYETETGQWLLSLGRSIGILGIWGIHGVRQRLLVYKPYSHIEFAKLMQFERSRHSIHHLALAGLPSFLAMHGISWTGSHFKIISGSRLLGGGLSWLRFHFHIWLTMQRLDIIPASRWLPDIEFFIPFSSSSPFPAPPPIETWSPESVSGWLSTMAINLAPYAAFFLCGRLWHTTHIHVWPHVLKLLPHPTRNESLALRNAERRSTTPTEQWPTIPESPTLGAADREIRHTRNTDQDLATLQALEGQASADGPPPIPLVPIRRQSTFSNRGEQDYGTDEEDSEMLNPTLISFDVDTSESNEQPAGIWSAELRPSYANDGRSAPRDGPVYVVNALTSLPSMLATDILTNFVAYILCAPYEALALRGVARAFSLRRGLPIGDIVSAGIIESLSWRGVGNILGLEIVRLLISGEVWALTAIISQWLHVTEEEWKEIHKEEEAEKAAQEAAREAAQAAS